MTHKLKITHHIKMRHFPAYIFYALFRIKRKFELEEFENYFSSIALKMKWQRNNRRRRIEEGGGIALKGWLNDPNNFNWIHGRSESWVGTLTLNTPYMRIRGGGHPSFLGCKPDLFMGCSVRGGGSVCMCV